MRSAFKAGPFKLWLTEGLNGQFWQLMHGQGAVNLIIEPSELNQIGRVIEKARKYQHTARKKATP